MNAFALVAGGLTLVAFFAHAVAGAMELRHIAPIDGSAKAAEVRVQVMNGWHWLSVDLLLATGLFLLIGATDELSGERDLLLAMAGYFVVVGVVWLVATAVGSRGRVRTILRLAQWLFCFVVAGLALAAR